MIIKEWLFKNTLNGFSPSGSIDYKFYDDYVQLKPMYSSSWVDWWISSNGNKIKGDASSYIEIIMKNTSGNTKCSIYHVCTPNNGCYNDATSKSFTISAKDTDFKTYIIPCSSIPHWGSGTFETLRFDLANGTDSTGFVQLKSIRIIQPNTSVNVNGVWKNSIQSANVNGVWKQVSQYVNVNGIWKNLK